METRIAIGLNLAPDGTISERAAYQLVCSNDREAPLADPHQVNAIIATAICDCRKDHPDSEIHAEEAKQIAKCILEALSDAGFQVLPVTETTPPSS